MVAPYSQPTQDPKASTIKHLLYRCPSAVQVPIQTVALDPSSIQSSLEG